ncbi:MAG: nitrilase-related carbon-nitrogen hydrolase, partial [Desulfobacterales bacterium]
MKDIRIAAVILNCPVGRVSDNLERMAGWVGAAKKQGVDVVCFPEMNVTGYSTRANIKKVAEPVPGKISQSVSEMAQAYDIAILAGLAEADLTGRVFASHLVVTKQGVAGTYR